MSTRSVRNIAVYLVILSALVLVLVVLLRPTSSNEEPLSYVLA